MFSQMLAELGQGCEPEPAALRSRLDMALTKKMGVLRLPPAFWPLDPKINPRTEHQLWAALLLGDRERIDQALALLATEKTQRIPAAAVGPKELITLARDQVRELCARVVEPGRRAALRARLASQVPELLAEEEFLASTDKTDGH